MNLATAVSESLPLDPVTEFRLLFDDPRRSSGIELDDQTRLRVSPVLRDPKLGILEAPEPHRFRFPSTLTAKATDNLLGWDTSLYVLHPKIGQRGYRIAAVPSERHLISTGANEALPKTIHVR